MEASGSVMIVDNDEVFLDLCRIILEGAGHSVATAHSGAQAIELALASRPAVAGISLELRPMDGLDLAAALFGLYRGSLPIFLMTQAGEDASGAARRMGAYGTLLKPFRRDELLDLVQIGVAKSKP